MNRSTLLTMILLLLLFLSLAGCSLPMKETSSGPRPEETTKAPAPETSAAPLPAAKQLEERWLSGDLSDLAGTFSLPETTDPEREAELKAIRDDFAAFGETAPETGAEEDSLLDLLAPYTSVLLPEIQADAVFPLETEMTLKTPDVAAILKELHYENYEDSALLRADLEAALKKGSFPERTVTLTVRLLKEGETIYAEENREVLMAFYGGFAELYAEEYQKYLEELGTYLEGQGS